jgi:hypothetical protein
MEYSMSLIVPGCVLLFALLAGIVLDTIDTKALADLRLRHSRDLALLPGGILSGEYPSGPTKPQ